MTPIPAVLGETQLQNVWFRGFRHHYTDRFYERLIHAVIQ